MVEEDLLRRAGYRESGICDHAEERVVFFFFFFLPLLSAWVFFFFFLDHSRVLGGRSDSP